MLLMFLFMMILSMVGHEAVVKNGIRSSWDSIMISDVRPSVGGSVAYLAGASVTKCFQIKKESSL